MNRSSVDDLSALNMSGKSLQSSGKSEYEDEYIVPMNVVDMTHGVIFHPTTIPLPYYQLFTLLPALLLPYYQPFTMSVHVIMTTLVLTFVSYFSILLLFTVI